MENLPPISTQIFTLDEMYTSMLEHKDYDVIRKYENTKINSYAKRSPTKKGSFLDDSIRMNSSPGPANKSNLQQVWALPNKQIVKYADRKTYVDQIAIRAKRRNSPSPNQYNVKMSWPDKVTKGGHACEKTNFLDNFEYESNKTPGPGNYMIATQIAKKTKEFHYTQNKPLQPSKEKSADMNTYDPIPQDYSTFKKYQKAGQVKTSIKKEEPKKQRQNLSPGPGQYQMINSWQGKQQKMPKGSLSYMSKITKGPSHGIYN